MLLAQKEIWARRTEEADAWQRISITLAKEVARQLRLSRFVLAAEEEAASVTPQSSTQDRASPRQGPGWSHDPYA